MNKEQLKQLDEMIQENNTIDTTKLIRERKHSVNIRKDLSKIENIKRRLKTKDFQKLDNEARYQCTFLYIHYPNIYNKMLKNEINLKVLYDFLDELEKIEKGKQNQHEASFKIGTLLKEIYIDKKLNLTKENESIQKKKITYEEFKRQQENKFKDK